MTLQHDGVSRWRPKPGTTPTRRDLECFAATLRLGRREAAAALGIHEHTVRLHISDLFVRLDVETRWEALLALGWLRIPPEVDLVGAGGAPRVAARAGSLGVAVRRSPGSPGAAATFAASASRAHGVAR